MDFVEEVKVDYGRLNLKISAPEFQYRAEIVWNSELDQEAEPRWKFSSAGFNWNTRSNYGSPPLSPADPQEARKAAAFILLAADCFEKGPEYWASVVKAKAKLAREAAEREAAALEAARDEGREEGQQ